MVYCKHKRLKGGIILKSGIKSVATWLIIIIILVILVSSIIENNDSKMTYSDLIEKIEGDSIESIEISADGETAYVTLKNELLYKYGLNNNHYLYL